ncbi:MAG TPA: hypothetical protein VEV43_15170, partial [Actinomycetota bacterium]|nr:hypothetical protein [Actinomycetota bacterium]
MRIDPRDPAFDPKVVWRRNLDIAVDPAALVFDRDVRPFDGDGPALLVPVDVQALSVPEDGAVDHADTSVRLVDAQELGDLAEATAAPFTEGVGRSAGIHLHWAMPDALTRGTTSESGVLSQPSLPDRWLVVRLGPGTERPWAGWVIESDYGRATPLSQWEGEPGDPDGDPPAGWIPPESLSAASGGDPAWAATFDNVVNRFAFHDPLTDVDGDLFTYAVVGWYGDDSLDPLDDVRSMGSFDHVMQSLGWTVSPEAHERARLEGLIRSNAFATAGAEGRAFRKVANRRELAVGAAFDDLTVDALDSVWPRRCVFHGAVFGVRRDGVGADHRPTPHDLSAALGATATEALARLIGDRHPQGGAVEERALAAFAYGIADRLGEPDGPALVEEQMHGRAFESRPGPPLHDWIRRTDRLKDVRPPKIRPAREDVLGGMLDEAAITRKDVAWKARFDFLPDADKDRIHEVGGVDVGKRLQAAVREIDRIEKVTRAGPRYFQPQDPVVAIQGSERHLRHGYDGRWTADETVACRLAGDTQDEWDDLTGAELLASPFVHAALPPEARHLVHEAALEDPSNVEETIAAATRRDPNRAGEIAARIRAEVVIGRYGRDPERQTDALAKGSSRHGTMSSGIGFNEWDGPPWIPLHLEWMIELDVGDRLGGWELGELDFDPPKSVDADPTKVL